MIPRFAAALLTPFLLWLAWPDIGFTPLLFIAFLPILWLEHSLVGERKAAQKLFLYSWLSFGLWNLLCTWWLVNAHWSAVATTVIVNGGLMALVMGTFRFVKSKMGAQRGYISLPFLWVSLEVLHQDWDLSFPWLNLGNGMATRVEWIQWYEYVGAMGGTLWIWGVNLLLFWALQLFLKTKLYKPLLYRSVSIILLAIILPISLSYMRYLSYQEKGDKVDVVVIQPNIDTYIEKNILSDTEQVNKFLKLAQPKLDQQVDFLVGPEVLLPDGIYQDQIASAEAITILQNTIAQYPGLHILVGATTLQYYPEGSQTSTARPFTRTEGYYDVYNTALFLNADEIELYHKSKLVAGVEMMPFANILKPTLGNLIENMGGTSGGLATQSQRAVFTSTNGKFKVTPLICWESDFGEYVTTAVRKGANLLMIITNDDWWGNTPGHIQHLHYARLRAIENRRSIARSANTGISCFINQRGDIIQPTSYKEEAALRATVHANNELTYYSRVGDFVGRLSLFLAGFLLLFALVRGYLRKVDSKV